MVAREQDARARREPPRLYLISELASDGQTLVCMLDTVLAAADVAAVLLRLPQLDERGLINLAKTAAPVVQRSGAALLLDGHPELVARAGADGAHLTGLEAVQAALSGLKPDRIAGAGGLKTRHDAMVAGEAGADYVMFGEPDETGRRPAFPAVLERIEWWSEVFEIPCVGFAGDADEVAALGRAGADFVALGACIWRDARGPAAALASAAERLSCVELA